VLQFFKKGHYKLKLLYGHMTYAHQTTPKKAGIFLRCDCGRAVQSHAHTNAYYSRRTLVAHLKTAHNLTAPQDPGCSIEGG
ncbi:hypothetical protein PFISCL1PPCAC_12459, partial [Pristionchus fissidentatus]